MSPRSSVRCAGRIPSRARAGTAGRIINRLVHHAFRVAKRVRTETGIGANAVSISYMAVELGKKIFNSLEGHTAL